MGRRLINELLKYINDNGVKDTRIAVELCAMPDTMTVEATTARAINFYHKYGFEFDGEIN